MHENVLPPAFNVDRETAGLQVSIFLGKLLNVRYTVV